MRTFRQIRDWNALAVAWDAISARLRAERDAGLGCSDLMGLHARLWCLCAEAGGLPGAADSRELSELAGEADAQRARVEVLYELVHEASTEITQLEPGSPAFGAAE